MNTDILNSIMKISNDKKDTLMYFLSPEVREKLPSYIKENIDINRFINA